jgi:tetratricopeptide (TPR) repeat protein
MSSLEEPPASSASSRVAADKFPPAPPLRWWQNRGTRVGILAAGAVVFLALALWPVARGVSRMVMAGWWHGQAETHALAGNFKQAVADMDQAITNAPNNLNFYAERARFRLEAGDFAGSLADYEHIIKANPSYAEAYAYRSRVAQRQGRYTDAVADLTKALELSTASEPEPWNNRAYGRALAKVELPEALTDAERALKLLKLHKPKVPDSAKNAELLRADYDRTEASYLDTRGFVQHLLGNQDQALADLNRALDLHKNCRKVFVAAAEKAEVPAPQLVLLRKEFDRVDAVMLHHRGLVQQALGHEKEADADLQWAEELGYNPAAGVE